MRGVYLDQAESEGRDRLTRSEKAGLVVGGVGARVDLVVPAAVRDMAATVMVSLLGAFGLIAGIVMEWAPGNPGPHLSGHIIASTGVAVDFAPGPPEPRAFGPFVSPFVIVCALAVAAWVFSLAGPERLYRWALGATVIAGLAAAAIAEPYSASYGWPYDFGLPGLFVATVGLIALSAARPRAAWRVTAGTVLWGCVIAVGYLALPSVGGFLQQYRQGMPTSSSLLFQPTIWSMPVITGASIQVSGDRGSGLFVQFGVVPGMLLVIALVLIGALALAIAGRRVLSATTVLATVPWAAYLMGAFVTSLTGESAVRYASERRMEYVEWGIDLLLLVALYAAVITVTMYFRRRSRIATLVNIDASSVGQ